MSLTTARLARTAAIAALAMVVATTSAPSGLALAQSPAPQPAAVVSQEFCDLFTKLGDAAQRDFKDMKGREAYRSNDFNFATLSLPEASSCVVSAESGAYLCSWRDRPVFRLRSDFQLLTRSIRACFPSYESGDFESGNDMFFNLTIPAGKKGGPTLISVNLERREIWMGIGKEQSSEQK